jgi:hypothetical protein
VISVSGLGESNIKKEDRESDGVSSKDTETPDLVQQELQRMVQVLGEGEAVAIFDKIKACPAMYVDATGPVQRKLAKLLLDKKTQGRASLSRKLKETREVRNTER